MHKGSERELKCCLQKMNAEEEMVMREMRDKVLNNMKTKNKMTG